MSAFADASQGRDVMTKVFQQIDLTSLRNYQIIYSYRFTDIDFTCTAIIRAGTAQLAEGILPESETIIETTSDIFDLVMTGQMNLVSAHLSGQVKVLGSVGNAFKLRAIVPSLSESYRAVKAQQTAGVSH
jgi:putative sterol carrier protein